jgi:hypothetical protein
MTKLILIYIGAVLAKWAYEALDWMEENRGGGFKGWLALEKIPLVKKAIMHGLTGTAWISGALLGMVNATAGGIGFGAIESVNPATTAMAGFILDSLGKPIVKRLRSKAKEMEGGG